MLEKVDIAVKGIWKAILVRTQRIEESSKAVVPTDFGTRDRFHGRQFFHSRGWGVGNGSGGNVSNGELQMKLPLLACRSPPAVRPGS